MKKRFKFFKTLTSLFVVALCLSAFSDSAKAQYIDNLSDAWSKAPTAAYSTRKVMSAYSGPAMTLRRSNDNATTDVYFDASGWVSLDSETGSVGSGMTLATWVGSSSAFVSKWYDQSENGNHATTVVNSGLITCNTGSATVTGGTTANVNITQFVLELAIGDVLYTLAGDVIGTVSAIGSASSLTLSGNAAVNLTAQQFYSSAQINTQPRFINAGTIETMPNGYPTLNILNGTNARLANGFTTPVTANVDGNFYVFAVPNRTNNDQNDAIIVGNIASWTGASANNLAFGYHNKTNLGIRSTQVSFIPTELNRYEAVRYYANAIGSTKKVGIRRLMSDGTYNSTDNNNASLAFTHTRSFNLFRPDGYAIRSFTGKCPEIIIYKSTTIGSDFNTDDETSILADQRSNFLVVTPPPANIQIGASKTYKTIQAAYNAISAVAPISQAYTIELQSDYNPAKEAYPITLTSISGVSETNTITIKPATGVKKIIGPANQTKTVTAEISSATTTLVLDNVTGLSTDSYVAGNYVYSAGTFKKIATVDAGTNTVTFASETFTNADPITTTFFIGPAQTQAFNFNGAQYVIIDGVSRTDALTGLTIQNPNAIYAQTLNFVNNANNVTVQNCIIRGANQTGVWNQGYQGTVFFNGSNTNTITNNDVCDMGDGSPYPVCAFQMTGSGTNHTNTVSNNNIYNISNIYASTATNSGFFQFGSTSNTSSHSNAILDNKIFFTGTAYLRSGSSVVGIGIGGSMNGLNNRLEGNIFGYANADGTGTSNLDMTGTSGTFKVVGNLKNFTCKNNTVSNISMTGGTLFTGIEFTASNASSPNSNDVCYGNQVKNINLEVTANSTLNGILWSVANPYSSNISNNTVNDLTLTSSTAGVVCKVNGIFASGTATGNTFNYSGNQVFNLTAGNSSSSAANEVYGLYTLGGTSTVERNLVYNLNAISTGTPIIKGIGGATGSGPQFTIRNNIVSLGSDVTSNATIYGLEYAIGTNANQTNNAFNYHNSIYISGTATKEGGPTSSTFAMFLGGNVVPTNHTIRNNIFANQRVNSESGSAKHYAFRFAYTTNVSIKNMDNNLYWATPLGLFSTTKEYTNLAAWKQSGGNTEIKIANDENSTEGNPQFLSATDLRVQPYSSAVAAKGANIASVTSDYYGTTRATTPAIGAYEFTYASQTSDNFRSLASGNWGANATWESSLDNTNWANATLTPTASAASVLIQNTHEVTIADANETASAITVQGGGKLTLNNGFTLNATGLTLQSHATNGTATLVDGNAAGGLTVSGASNVEQHLTSGRNWYISSPVATATSNVFGAESSTTNKLWSYSESTASTEPWPQISNNTTVLQVTKGYVTNMPSSGVVNFGGTLNTGSYVTGENGIPALTRTSGQAKEGFNLVGNPYPSYLNWELTGKNKISSTIWYRTQNPGNPGGEPAVNPYYVFDTYGASSGVGTNLNGSGDVTALIPPMQAFWVRVTPTNTTGTLTFNNNAREHREADKAYNKFRAPSAVNKQIVRLEVANGTYRDETILVFSENAQDNLDDFDSPKMTNNLNELAEIFTTVENERLVINGMKSIPVGVELPLGFTTLQAGVFTIRTKQMSNVTDDLQLILKDHLLDTEQVLNNDQTYSFSSDPTNTDSRFSLEFRAPDISTGYNYALINALVFVNSNRMPVVQLSQINDNAEVKLMNIAGRVIAHQPLLTETTELRYSLEPGIYFVKVVNGIQQYTYKIKL